MLSSRSPVSLSSSSATLLLFLFVSLPLPLPLLATPAPDQYGAATAQHHGHQPKLRSIKLQPSDTLLPQQETDHGQLHSVKLHHSGYMPSETLQPLQQPHDGQLHSIKLQHSGYAPSESLLPLQTPQENDKLSSDHNKKDARSVRSVDASQIHRVKLTKSDYQTGSLLPLQVSQLTRKEGEQKKNDVPLSEIQSGSDDVGKTQKKTIHYEGDDDITIDDIKALDGSLQGDYSSPLEELDINVEDNNVPHIYSNIRRAKREEPEETVRQKRDFIRWYGTSFQAQPSQHTYVSSYQLSARVPYFIPIWGNPSRIPVYFPLRPILFNPGYPVANPPVPQQTPQPDFPFAGSTENPPAGNVSIGNRINVEQEDNPVWGVVESEPNFVPQNNAGGARPNTPPRKPPTPPLLHRPSRTDEDDNDNLEPNRPPITQIPNELNPNRPSRPSNTIPVTRPPQNFPQIPDNNRDPLFEFANTQRPIFVPIPTTTRRPEISGFPGNNQVINNSRPREPSRCVWAVISCCSPLSNNVRYSCFEQLGCNGSFWDGNPCSREYTTAALNAAQKFYEQTGTRR